MSILTNPRRSPSLLAAAWTGAVLATATGCGAPPANDPSKASASTPAERPATPGLCGASGYCWESPVPAPGTLTAAWASGPNDVYAAGRADRVLHFDGTVWKTESAGKGWTNGLWGSGPDDVILVGDEGLIRRRKGGTWQSEDVEDTNQFNAVWGSGPNDVFAVGDRGLVFHFDGKSWSGQTTGSSASLGAVWGSGPTDVYAVGHLAAEHSGVVLHYDGRSWDASAPVGRRLERVWGTGPKDVWVAGADPKERIALWKLSAGTGEWKPEPVTSKGELIGLSGTGDKPVLLMHADTSPENGMSFLRGQVFALEWTGTTWQRRPLMTISSPIGKPGWGLASDGKGTLIAAGWWGVAGTFQPGAPVSGEEELRFSTGNAAIGRNLLGVWGTSPSDVVAVGAAGAMLRYDGQAWVADPAGKDLDLTAIHGAKDILVAVARRGTLLVRKEGVWSRVETGTSSNLNGVWTDGDQIFASGAAGTMIRCDAKGCAPMATGAKMDLWEIWGLGPNEVYVNGDKANLLRWDGTSWKMMLGPKDGFSTIGPDGQGSMMGVTFDTTYHVEQGSWVRLGAATGYGAAGPYRSIGEIGEGQVVGAYGGGGAPIGVRRWDGKKWVDEPVPDGEYALGAGILRSVWGTGGEVFIVGDGGAILHKKRR